MPKFHKSIFKPKHPEKYIGRGAIIARSSWETSFFIFLDNHPSVLQWASESIVIPYFDPLTNKKKNYYPDVFMVYQDSNGVKHAEIIEIKPANQCGMKKTKSVVNKAQCLRNSAKWSAAMQYCEHNGIQFRVLTENELGFK